MEEMKAREHDVRIENIKLRAAIQSMQQQQQEQQQQQQQQQQHCEPRKEILATKLKVVAQNLEPRFNKTVAQDEVQQANNPQKKRSHPAEFNQEEEGAQVTKQKVREAMNREYLRMIRTLVVPGNRG